MTTVKRWTGEEVKALRAAKRMSIHDFAAQLGISERMVSKWEAGGASICPRPINQQNLDTTLSRCDPDTKARFANLVGESLLIAGADEVELLGASEVRHPGDGCPMVLVDASVFLSGPGNEPVWLDAFYIDVYPVTNAQYARFCAATARPVPQHWAGGTFAEGLDDHPVVFVTWHDAAAYAAWAGKALPTAQQWEKAARGTAAKIYPWGDQPTPAKCNVRENGVDGTTKVGTYQSGQSPYGLYDVCGNVWEWCSSTSVSGRYELKGGAWTSAFLRATPSAWNDAAATMLDDDTGFRCIAAPAD